MTKHRDKYMNREALPDSMKVEEMTRFLGIGRKQGYELVNRNEFHVARIGRTIRISKKCFLEWFDGQKPKYSITNKFNEEFNLCTVN